MSVLLVVIVTGCNRGDSATRIWQDYDARLSRVLETDLSSPPLVEDVIDLPRFSPPKRRLLNSGAAIGLLELGSLGHCSLGRLIANHNSSLGKVAEPATALSYHLQFIQQAPECLATLADGDLKRALTGELERKRAGALNQFLWFLENDKVIRQRLFVHKVSFDPGAPRAGLIETQQSLSELLAIRQAIENARFDDIAIERLDVALAVLNRQELLPRYMGGIGTQLGYLSKLNAALEHQKHMRCQPGHNNQRQQVLLNILEKYFIGRIQVYLGNYVDTQFTFTDTILKLFANSAWSEQIEFYFADTGAISVLKEQVRRHVQIWQSLQQSCRLEIRPGSAGSY